MNKLRNRTKINVVKRDGFYYAVHRGTTLRSFSRHADAVKFAARGY